MKKLPIKAIALFLILQYVHIPSYSQKIPFPISGGVMEGDSASLSALIGVPSHSSPSSVASPQITSNTTTESIDLASKSVNYSMCVNMPWRSWAGVCPANFVLVGAWRRPSDTGEWNSFRCCKIQ